MLAAKSSPNHILSIIIIIIITIIIIVVIVITTHLRAFKLLVYKWQTSSTCPEICTQLS